MITIIDSGGANISSIQCCLNRLGVDAKLTKNAYEIRKSSHVILPGVGSASRAMERLTNNSLISVIQSLTQPVLGICLGMQILFDYSDEGNVDCLKIISGKITRLNTNSKLVIPHMGWNNLNIIRDTPIVKNVCNSSYMYFVHSYIAPIGNFTVASTSYGETFSAVVRQNNFVGTQFHPERSSQIGSIILKNFLEM